MVSFACPGLTISPPEVAQTQSHPVEFPRNAKSNNPTIGMTPFRCPPKYSVAQVIGCVKGKSAIHIARTFGERKRNLVGQHFWARGYFVSTVGRDEGVIREHIRRQEQEDKRLDQLRLV